MISPSNIQLIGTEVAILWSDGEESYIPFVKLRAESPSAATKGEVDILGTRHGGEFDKSYEGVSVTTWQPIGNYAIRFSFSDGHGSGLYDFPLLRKLGGNDN